MKHSWILKRVLLQNLLNKISEPKYSIQILYSICFVSFLFNQLNAQEENEIIIISERVGKEIDLKENEKFKIFPNITGFQSAVYVKLSDNNYFLEISYLDNETGELKVKRIEQSETSIKNRGLYIDRFEELQIKGGPQDTVQIVYEAPGTAFFLELGGKPFFSINTDFSINPTNRFSIGIQPVYGAIIPNIMYYYVDGGANSQLEVGGGISYLPVDNKDLNGNLPLFFHGVIGYRYQKKNGLFFRIGFTPILVVSVRFLPMIGISLGYSL